MSRGRFYGNVVVVAAWLCYGLAIAPAFYGWGFFLPELARDLGLSRQTGGQVFGLFNFLYAGLGPVVGLLVARWGSRRVMAMGGVIAAIGLLATSRAGSALACYLCFSLLTGAGVGLATLVPATVLGAEWFVRRRARALGLIFTAGGVVGAVWPRIGAWVLARGTWRDGFVLAALAAAAAAVLAAVLVRDRPSELGQLPDGADAPDPLPAAAPPWKPARALATRSFALVCFAAAAYSMPWMVVISHGRLHLQDLGAAPASAASVLGTMTAMSVVGRLAAASADVVRPERVLAVALAVEAAGVAALAAARGPLALHAAGALVGLGFGASYVTVSVLLASLFGCPSLPATAGVRFLVAACFTALAPGLAGAVHDRSGSYASAFLAVAITALAGAGATFWMSTAQRSARAERT